MSTETLINDKTVGDIGAESAVAASGLIANLAAYVGAPEPAFRLLLTIIAGYPIAAIYRQCFHTIASKSLHHCFFTVCGYLLCIFNYGFDIYHSLISIWITYALVRLLHTMPKVLIGINFVFHMTYLLVGYYFTESNDYDILWTMPHCVLVLRMIGFGFDIADGQKPKNQLTKDQEETCLHEIPSLLELTAFAYFPSGFLIGPQFPFRRYRRFIDGEFRQFGGCIQAGIKRMLVGILYLGIRQIGASYVPDDYFLSDAFRSENFIMRLIYLGLWGKLSLYKYISCWLLTEGALMCIGFSYNGKTADGAEDWYGCSNVKLIILETGNTMQHYVQSFNVNTNHWVAQYVYKRLKYLNNRTISYVAALSFLAVWHGFHSGYYMSFVLEYMIVTVEKQIESVYTKAVLPAYGQFLESNLLYRCLKFIALKSYNIIYMGWCLTPFIFLNYNRWMRVFSSVNYFGFLYMAIWLVIYQVYKRTARANERQRTSQVFSNATTLSADAATAAMADSLKKTD